MQTLNIVADAALELFVLEKTVYEIAYEAANRPAWLGVPLRGLAAIVDQLSTSEQLSKRESQ